MAYIFGFPQPMEMLGGEVHFHQHIGNEAKDGILYARCMAFPLLRHIEDTHQSCLGDVLIKVGTVRQEYSGMERYRLYTNNSFSPTPQRRSWRGNARGDKEGSIS